MADRKSDASGLASFVTAGTILLLVIAFVAVVLAFFSSGSQQPVSPVQSQPALPAQTPPSGAPETTQSPTVDAGTERISLPALPKEEASGDVPAEEGAPQAPVRRETASAEPRLDQYGSAPAVGSMPVTRDAATAGDTHDLMPLIVLFLLLMLIGLVVLVARKGIKVVQQGEAVVVERLGKFHKVEKAGIHVHIPYIDKVKKKISLQEQMIEISSQESITSDMVPVIINGVVFYKIEDDKKGEGVRKAVYNIKDLDKAIKQVAQTALRSEISNLKLDEVLAARRRLNSSLLSTLDSATKDWGAKVTRVEISDIDIPDDIKHSLNQKNSIIRIAEGDLRKTEKQAQAMQVLSDLIGREKAAEYLLTQDRIKAFAKLAETSSANKVVVPYDVMEVIGSLSIVRETVHSGPFLDSQRIRTLAGMGETTDSVAEEVMAPDHGNGGHGGTAAATGTDAPVGESAGEGDATSSAAPPPAAAEPVITADKV